MKKEEKKRELPYFLITVKLIISLAVTIFIVSRIIAFYGDFLQTKNEVEAARQRIVLTK